MGNWLTLISVAALAASAVLLAVLFRLRQRHVGKEVRRVPAAVPARDDETVRRLQDRLGLLNVHTAGVGQRLQELEQQLRLLAERQDQAAMREPESQPFALAIKLARRGATAEELMSTCGLPRGEAELVVMLHRKDTAPARG